MRKFALASTVALCSLMCACAGNRRAETFDPPPFDEQEYAALAKTGTGIVRGQVFAVTVGGDVKKGAGNSVVLFPATKYGDLRYREQILGGKLLSTPEDPRYQEYARAKVTDGEGRFEFSGVPPGSYYVLSSVSWFVIQPSSFGPISLPQGGKVAMKIDVKNNQVTDAMLKL